MADPDHGGSMSATRAAVRQCLALGMPDKMIARRTGRAYGTVKSHVRLILREMGASNRTEAALRLRERGPA